MHVHRLDCSHPSPTAEHQVCTIARSVRMLVYATRELTLHPCLTKPHAFHDLSSRGGANDEQLLPNRRLTLDQH